MKKQIILLIGSPRKDGNSNIVGESFRRGAEEAGHEVIKLYVSDFKSDVSARRSTRFLHKIFHIKDGRHKLALKMCEADVIVLATPVFNGHFPTEVKRLMSVFYSVCPDIEQRKLVLLVNAAESLERIQEKVMERYDHLFGVTRKPQLLHSLICGGVVKPGDVEHHPQFAEVAQYARSL